MDGTDYYTTFDLPIAVTNSISTTTQRSSSKARPLCALRNNPLQSQINTSTMPLPLQPSLGPNVSGTGSSSSSDSSSGSASGTSTPTSTRLSAPTAAAPTSEAAQSGGRLSGSNFAIVLGCGLGGLGLGLPTLVFVACYKRRWRSRNKSPRVLWPDAEKIGSWKNYKNQRKSRDGLRLNPPG